MSVRKYSVSFDEKILEFKNWSIDYEGFPPVSNFVVYFDDINNNEKIKHGYFGTLENATKYIAKHTNTDLKKIKKLVKEFDPITVVKERILYLHKKRTTLRVIAEKISSFDLDEWKALNIVVETLYAEGVRWSQGQMNTAIKYCFDPRYYTKDDIKDLYKKAGFNLQFSQIPKKWKGITEWKHKRQKLRRLSSDDLKAGKNEMEKNAYDFFKTK